MSRYPPLPPPCRGDRQACPICSALRREGAEGERHGVEHEQGSRARRHWDSAGAEAGKERRAKYPAEKGDPSRKGDKSGADANQKLKGHRPPGNGQGRDAGFFPLVPEISGHDASCRPLGGEAVGQGGEVFACHHDGTKIGRMSMGRPGIMPGCRARRYSPTSFLFPSSNPGSGSPR